MNGNILGEEPSEVFTKQIKIRQEKLALKEIPDDVITWYSSKNVWLRLASSVNKNGSDLLAKNNILFGGTLGYNNVEGKEKWSLKPGFTDINSSYDKTQYGFKPMPGIIEAKITGNAGNAKIKIADIKIKVYSPEQLEIIEQLYLRLKYSILLEWGHTIYLNNNGNTQTFNNFTTKPFIDLFTPGITQQKILEDIELERQNYYGNYDGFFGSVTSFNYNFNQDGSYDVNLTAVTQGDILESMTVGVADNQNKTETNKPVIELTKDITRFNKFLQDITIKPQEEVKKLYNLTHPNSVFYVKNFKSSNGWLWVRETNTQYYITLGGLLEYLEKNRNIFAKNQSYLRYNYDPETNLCLTYPGHISADPRICLIPVTNPKTNEVLQKHFDRFKINDNPYLGRLMCMLINVDFLSNLLISLRRKNGGGIMLYDFLTNILLEINDTLGNQNKLDLHYDVETGEIKILELAPLNYKNFKPTKPRAEFNLFGIGNFIKEVNFNVSPSKEMASMLAIGAASNGNQPGTNATAVSQYNKDLGLEDRTFPTKNTLEGNKPPNPNNIIDKISNALELTYKNKDINKETIEVLKSINKEYGEYTIGQLTEKGNIAAPFFLPFNLSLNLDGISGIKFMQKIDVSPSSIKILPSYYKDKEGNPIANMYIKGIDHTIRNNRWETQLNTIMSPINFKTSEAELFQALTEPIQQPIPPTYEKISCDQEATIKLSPSFNLAQVSCRAAISKYHLPQEGEIKNTYKGNFTRQQLIDNLKQISLNVLEHIKHRYPSMIITSGYRNKGTRSQHELGEAIDIQFGDIVGTLANQNEKMLERAKDIKELLSNKVGFDQFLLEYKTERGGRPWIHISYSKTNRKQYNTFLNDVCAINGRNNLYNPLA